MSGSSSSSFENVALAIGLTELRAAYPTLTGAGVIVAQIEANLDTSGTGAPAFEPDPTLNSQAAFTFTDGSAATTIYNDQTIGSASSHADKVGAYFYGSVTDSAGAPEGVAPGVSAVDVYYAGSFSLTGTVSFAAKVVNLSFAYTTPAGGNDLYDQLANQFNAVVVAAAGNSGAVTSPASAYNVIAVSSSTATLATGPAADGAEKPDISAPGSYSSFTAPIVSGAAALLVQAGTSGLAGWSAAEKSDAVDFRTVKAILLNSATKPSDYFTNAYAPTAAQPLSAEYGSGVVNVYAAVQELYAGEVTSTSNREITQGGSIYSALAADGVRGENGWALGTLSNGAGINAREDVQGYAVTVAAGTSFVATLDWAASNSDVIDNLQLYAYDETTGTMLASSTATLSSVEQIYLTPAAGEVIDLFVVLPDGSIAGNSDVYALAYGDPVAPVCYCAGTRIRTAAGEVAVEALQAGDLVLTPAGAQPVRWIGQNHVSTRFGDPLRVLPIRIAAGALGEGVPGRDLRVSPDHAVYVAGVLVQAGALVNGTTIRREADVPELFTYYHVELPVHALIYAEGALAESFVDNVARAHFQNWDERRVPVRPVEEMALPRVKSARQVPRAVRRVLAERMREIRGGAMPLPV